MQNWAKACESRLRSRTVNFNQWALTLLAHTNDLSTRGLTFSLALIAGVGLLSTGRFAIPPELDNELRFALSFLVSGLGAGIIAVILRLLVKAPGILDKTRAGHFVYRVAPFIALNLISELTAIIGFAGGAAVYVWLLFKVI